MSGSLVGNTIRADVANQDFTVPFEAQVFSDGSQGSVAGSIASNTNLVIDLPTGGTATSLFLGSSFSFIQNINDTGAVIVGGAADPNTPVTVYEGDSAGQSFYAGAGTEYAAFTGYGNLFVAPTVGGGTYEISAGLVGGTAGNFDAVDLAAAPAAGSAQMGNTVVAGSGNASISAGLGQNAIFLGSGTALVANEGTDSIVGGSGAATVDGAGAATVFAGTGALSYFGSGGTAVIDGSSDTTSGALSVLGGSGAVTVYGGGGSVNAAGGSAGGNVLVGGSGNSTLFGGSASDTLVAGTTGMTTLVAGAGNESLYGGGASNTTDFFLGSGSDTVTGGSGNEFIQFGSGSSTVFAGTGSDVLSVVNGTNGGSDLVIGFSTASDFLNLKGFGTESGTPALGDVTVSGGNSYIAGPNDSTTIELYGVTNLTTANFV